MAKSKTRRAKEHVPEFKGDQFSRCVEINTYENKKGKEMEIYTMVLDGNEFQPFTLFERSGFKLRLDDCCLPVIAIVPTGYLDKNNQPRSRNIPMVNWVLSGEQLEHGQDEQESHENLQ